MSAIAPRARDASIAIVLSLFALIVGVFYARSYERLNRPPEPWARELGAAVAFACGLGLADPGYDPSPEVAAFLDKKIDRLSCAALPAGVALRPANFTQRLYRHMTLAVGITWRLFGISWTALSVLLGVLYAGTAAALYGLFRLATTRAIAAIGTVIMTLSPLQLRYLPQLRDYAKAPFLLLLILILGLLVTRRVTTRRLLLLAAAYGVVLGIGFGFRNDLLIAMLPFVVTVFVFLPLPFREGVPQKLAAVAVCAAAFAIPAFPIITAYRSGSNSGHAALLGLMTYFDKPLGVNRSVYDWGEPYDDGYAIKVIGSYSGRVEGRSVVPLSAEYDKAVFDYMLLVGRHWPADVLVRAYASVLRVLELPFQMRLYTAAVPPAIGDGAIARLYESWVGAWSRLSGIGTVAVLTAIAAAAAASLRVGIWLVLALLYFGGYPALQFDPRHFFFLEFVPWLALLSLAAFAVRLASSPPARADLAVRRAVVFAVALAVVAIGSLVVLRAYQQRHVRRLIEAYLETPTERLTLSAESSAKSRTLLRANEMRQSTEETVRAEYLVAEIAPGRCADAVVPLTVRYDTLPTYTDLSRQFDVPVPIAGAPFRLFFPVYYSSGGYFAGLELPDADRACVTDLRRVTNIDRTAILLTLTLPPDWREMKLYQTLGTRGVRFWSRG